MAENEWKSTTGEIFRFEKEGDSIEGTLANIRDGKYFRPETGAKSKVFDIRTKDGTMKSIFGTAVLERLLSSVQLNTEVKVTFKGVTKTKAGNDLKQFEVFTK